MRVKIKRFDQELPLPEYKTSGSVGFDIYTRVDTKIGPSQVQKIPANLGVAVPKGYYLMVEPRSSTMFKFGLLVIGGTIDQDYSGDTDEINITVYNLTKKTVTLAKGTRVAQGIFSKIAKAKFVEVKKLGKKSRGGFGTTGYK